MKIKNLISEIEQFAPLAYQENYDNCGVQVGDVNQEARAALLALDVTEAVIEEAIRKECNLVISHHPLLFSGLKRITGKNYVERVLLKAIKHDIVIYAAHTNLDNVRNGVNHKIAEKLLLQNTSVLAPARQALYKLYTYCPDEALEPLRNAFFEAGLGSMGEYRECSFSSAGTGTFRGSAQSQPFIGEAGGGRETVAEWKLEILVPRHLAHTAVALLKAHHPYEEVAYELVRLENDNPNLGAGLIGELEVPVPASEFLPYLKQKMDLACIRHTAFHRDMVQRVAVCGGSGSFLLPDALSAGADIFVTADFKYHQFFDAEQKIVIADIGHYESERYTIEIFSEILKKKFPNFALLFTEVNTNPLNYFL